MCDEYRVTGAYLRNNGGVQQAFGTVLWLVCGFGVLVALFALIGTGKTWEDYGRSRLLLDSDSLTGRRPAPPGSASALLERDTEIREMLEARNARRRRRGEPEIDVEAELRRLTTPQIDADLRAEIRDFVIARNHRRARRGEPLLDVEAEVEREIAGLSRL
jgi:hypothetical protein